MDDGQAALCARFSKLQVPVRLPGQFAHSVPIRPGDIVLRDLDGVVIVPAERAEEVAANAETRNEIERRIKADLAKGEDREAGYAATPVRPHLEGLRTQGFVAHRPGAAGIGPLGPYPRPMSLARF